MHLDLLSPFERVLLRVCANVVLAMIIMAIVVGIILGVAYARDDGQFAQADPAQRQWFREQHAPKALSSCCSEADGIRAEEDIRMGDDGKLHYWTRFVAVIMLNDMPIREEPIDWMMVPDEAVLVGPFDGRAPQVPVVWWAGVWSDSRYGELQRDADGKPRVFVRCFKPGAGI